MLCQAYRASRTVGRVWEMVAIGQSTFLHHYGSPSRDESNKKQTQKNWGWLRDNMHGQAITYQICLLKVPRNIFQGLWSSTLNTLLLSKTWPTNHRLQDKKVHLESWLQKVTKRNWLLQLKYLYTELHNLQITYTYTVLSDTYFTLLDRKCAWQINTTKNIIRHFTEVEPEAWRNYL